jgi:methylase of polypeptide subunit release factors
MQLPELLDALGYSTSGNFFQRGTAAFDRAPDIGHILRAAARRKACRLDGVYALRPFDDEGSPVPVVYVCEADDMAAADEIHTLVWNQDIVPFLLIRTPTGLRLYSGFKCSDTDGGEREGILEPLIQFNEIGDRLAEFRAAAIDSGELWRKRGEDVQPDKRAYWSLLENLKQLAKKFREQFGRDNVKSVIHPLIGKYVYLHYLKDRGFLSPRRLEEWKLEHGSVFGRTATLAGLRTICEKLDGFLNGRVFPLKLRGANAPTEDQIQRIAGAFAGDTFDGQWQFHLPFTAFKFAYIPIETLSMIYEQFLHLPEEPEADEDDEHSEGRKAGAYYTPIPVVNYMLAGMDKRRRLQRGVRVFDPSCGSGAFLVQCYRRLIEREFIHRKKKPAPRELATLLKRHIFGVDMDEDACSVAEFSLYLTLLDYVEPADLIDHPRFRLPTLRDNNIFQSDFFAFKPFKTKFHWIVGNPPWTKPKGEQAENNEVEVRSKRVLAWMKKHAATMPVGKNAVAQAFAWRCREFLARDGVCALLIPAMTLFEDPSTGFRRRFFHEHRLHAVANFSNLAEVLFAGRSRVPAAAILFGLRKKNEQPDDLEMTTVFSPLVANQEPTRSHSLGVRTETWSITVNGDEVRELPRCDIASGSGLPWKLATWGSGLDKGLLTKLWRKFDSLGDCEADWKRAEKAFVFDAESGKVFGISEGLQLRPKDGSCIRRRNKAAVNEQLESVTEVKGKQRLLMSELECVRRVFSFTDGMAESVPDSETWVRKGRKLLPLAVCSGPHVVVGENRTFATFVRDFLIVPGRQIGIVSTPGTVDLLKALALFLSSDFTFYHEFFVSSTFGVKRPISTLSALRKLPCPLPRLSNIELQEWAALHDELAKTSVHRVSKKASAAEFFGFSSERQKLLVRKMNDMVAKVLGLDMQESALIHDLIYVRFGLDDGDQDLTATAPGSEDEFTTYAEWLQREFDGQADGERHSVTVLHDEHSGFVAIEPAKDRALIRVVGADAESARTLARTREQLREEHAQWVYFDRSLRLHRGEKTYLFKPIQRMHWTRTRALLDAADITIGQMSED